VIDPQIIMRVVNKYLGRTLKAAKIGMKSRRFEAFHAVAMDEFGHKGLKREIYDLCGVRLTDAELKSQDMTGFEPTDRGKKGGAP
jgi:hypothetical protein